MTKAGTPEPTSKHLLGATSMDALLPPEVQSNLLAAAERLLIGSQLVGLPARPRGESHSFAIETVSLLRGLHNHYPTAA